MGQTPRLVAVVMAAGQGTRLLSDTPKVLHRAGGRPLVGHVLAALEPLGAVETVMVVPPEHSALVDAFGDSATFAVQDPPAGTGDAVKVALAATTTDPSSVLVVNGDSPLVQPETFRRLLDIHERRAPAATILTAVVPDAHGLGRVVRDADGAIDRIVEERDATEDERRINEINCGAYVFDRGALDEMLDKIDTENEQSEYYLTDVIRLLRSRGDVVLPCTADADEAIGVNHRHDLARVNEILRRRVCQRWMDQGVTILDPATTYIDATVSIGRDATILPFTFLEGTTSIGERAEIGPQVRVVDSAIGAEASVSFAVIRESEVGNSASVGPFASLRPGTRLEEGSRAGTFVETKNTTLGADSKANHLSYLGDAEIGRGVNVGAGTITCNWDGTAKHKTVIEDDAYIGSDTMLVAPTHIGRRAATGAGSVVRGDVPDDALAVGVPARIIEGKGNKMDRLTRADEDVEKTDDQES
ncbi:MAG TPA: bifunctional UDP-N-acetylglucosamine diphosphorylase/glucosamine-1-phosphate N-acetyltransferase GlmU [Actinomycetota bacterium]|nr:bifunctional UDP-N-acetylglucosamine diphosphorylase/glucosamine-1-phosphate N-acetyltransferase GlmU [Actinomycetota bacterium]